VPWPCSQLTGISNADTILACMSSKGYSGVRLDNPLWTTEGER
jgi:hypothetical protein